MGVFTVKTYESDTAVSQPLRWQSAPPAVSLLGDPGRGNHRARPTSCNPPQPCEPGQAFVLNDPDEVALHDLLVITHSLVSSPLIALAALLRDYPSSQNPKHCDTGILQHNPRHCEAFGSKTI